MNTKDVECGQPHLRPGDVVETPKGNLGVITKAGTTINGCSFSWDEFPLTEQILFERTASSQIDHGHLPSYAVAFRSDAKERTAWWTSLEFKRVVSKGVFHPTPPTP